MQSLPSPQNQIPPVSNDGYLDSRHCPIHQSSESLETQELTWAMLDEQITPSQAEKLEALLLSSPESRVDYISVVQLHVNLLEFFGGAATPMPAL